MISQGLIDVFVKSVVKMKAFEQENPVRICAIEGLVQMSEFFFPVHNSLPKLCKCDSERPLTKMEPDISPY